MVINTGREWAVDRHHQWCREDPLGQRRGEGEGEGESGSFLDWAVHLIVSVSAGRLFSGICQFNVAASLLLIPGRIPFRR